MSDELMKQRMEGLKEGRNCCLRLFNSERYIVTKSNGILVKFETKLQDYEAVFWRK